MKRLSAIALLAASAGPAAAATGPFFSLGNTDFIVLIAFLIFFPILWTFLTSFKTEGEAIAYHEILHASDPAFLSAHAQGIADGIVTGERGVLAIDTRFMTPGDDQGTVETIRLPRWYRPADVAPRDVDHLHSEVILLDQKLP